MINGSCLCGEITISVAPCERGAAEACHCTQCRKQSGHYWTSVDLPDAALTITGTPRWYASSDTAKRGFCGRCGSLLFWKEEGADRTNLSMGAFDGPTGVKTDMHIFVADKGDYYEIADGLPQHARFGENRDD